MSSITIASNISSLRAQRLLGQSTDALNRSSQKLASGMRINSASDDAAGLAVSMGLRSNSRVFNQAVRNVNDGISLLNIADGTLSNLSDIVIRMRELAEQSANGTYSHTQRTAMNAENLALTAEYNRLLSSSDFNGLTLLDGSFGNLSIQAGYGSTDGQISMSLGGQLQRTVGDGTFQSAVSLASGTNAFTVVVADVNGDSNQDLINVNGGDGSVYLYISNGNGTFIAPVSFQTGGTGGGALVAGDVNEDGKMDFIYGQNSTARSYIFLGNGNGTFLAPTSFAPGGADRVSHLADLDNDGNLDLIAAGSGLSINVLLGNGNGTFKAQRTFNNGTTFNRDGLEIADMNDDGVLDLISTDSGGNVNIFIGNGDGSFQNHITFAPGFNTAVIEVGDVNSDGIQDILTGGSNSVLVSLGNLDGSFKVATSFAAAGAVQSIELKDLDDDGILDVVAGNSSTTIITLQGNGDGTFKANNIYAASTQHFSFGFGDFNRDGATDIVGAAASSGTLDIMLADTRVTTELARTNLSTKANARSAMDFFEGVASRIALERGSIGSSLSRYSTAVNNLRTQSENLVAAESRITSTDIASESALLVKNQILREAGASVLAQANQQPALALQLLRG